MTHKPIDRIFLVSLVLLVLIGAFIFLSASLGLLAKDGPRLGSVAFSQLILGLLIGGGLCFFVSRLHYKFWRRAAFYIFLTSIVVSLLVFIPGIGREHAGASRWIDVFGFSFQPSEFLKLAFILYLAAWLASVRDQIQTFRFGLLPLVILIAILAGLLLFQPDTDTFLLLLMTAVAMFLAAGGSLRHLGILAVIVALGLGVLAANRPYLKDRLETFLNPSADPQGKSFQIQQSLIAIGSGEIWGKGFGQSVQKFGYLPEPIGDSVFAVAAEEFGFAGSTLLVMLFLVFSLRGLRIAGRAPDFFAGEVVLGIVFLITIQSFANIAAMLGIIPLSGMPLLFVSHGGTALLFTLIAAGIVLNISRYQHNN